MLMVGWVDYTHNDSYSLCRYWDFASVHACATFGVRMEEWSVLGIFFNLVKKSMSAVCFLTVCLLSTGIRWATDKCERQEMARFFLFVNH